MARRIVCFLLSFLYISSAFGQAPDLIGKRLVIRHYDQRETNREAYQGFPAEIKSDKLDFDLKKLSGRGVLVVAAADQVDTGVAAALGNGIYSAQYENGVINPGWDHTNALTWSSFKINNPANWLELVIQDAFGEPIGGAAVQAMLGRDGPVVGNYKTDANGAVDLPYPGGAFISYELKISHGRYGTFLAKASDQRMNSVGIKGRDGKVRVADLSSRMPERQPIKLLAVAADDPVLDRCLLGRVLMPDGKPAAGAIITASHVIAGGGIMSGGGEWRVVSGPDGHFRAYFPSNTAYWNRGELVPKGAQYVFSVEMPNDPQQPRMEFCVPGGTETDIQLKRGDRPRRFAFADQKGPITDPRVLGSIHVRYTGEAGSKVWNYDPKQISEARQYLPGRYEASSFINGIAFEPVTIDATSPDVITFRQALGGAVFSGRVVDAMTSRPLAGITVIATFSRNGMRRIEDLTHAQWDAIHKLPLRPNASDAALAPLSNLFGLAGAARTDAEGRYQIDCEPGRNVYSMIAIDENYLAVSQRVHQLGAGNHELPAFRLYPAAFVTLAIDAPATDTLSFLPKWRIDRSTVPPQSADLFFPKRPGLDFSYLYSDWVRFRTGSTTASVQVPAGIALGLDLDTLNSAWRPIHIPGPIKLAHGEWKDLGAFKPKPAAQIPVQVVGPDGEPLEGVAVLCRPAGAVGRTETTVFNGIARFWVEPGSKGEFSVFLWDQQNKTTMPRVSFNCAEEATKLPVHKITLTAEQIAKVRETAKAR